MKIKLVITAVSHNYFALRYYIKQMNSKINNYKLVLSGFLIVNIPITFIMLTSIGVTLSFTNLNFTESLIIAFAIGWTYWEFASRYWIKWSLKRGVEKNRLHKIGIKSFVLWPSDMKKIEQIEAKLNQN